jgi:hypothetical protein
MTAGFWRVDQWSRNALAGLGWLFAWLELASYEWFASLGMATGTAVAVSVVLAAAGFAVPLVLWTAAGRTFHVRAWLLVGAMAPAALATVLSFASGVIELYTAVPIALTLVVFAAFGVKSALTRHSPKRVSA